jgi:hypothetical protein
MNLNWQRALFDYVANELMIHSGVAPLAARSEPYWQRFGAVPGTERFFDHLNGRLKFEKHREVEPVCPRYDLPPVPGMVLQMVMTNLSVFIQSI